MLRFAVLLDGVDPDVVPGLAAYLFTGKERRSLTIWAEDMSRALDGQALKISMAPGGGYLLELLDYEAACAQAETSGADVAELVAGRSRKSGQ